MNFKKMITLISILTVSTYSHAQDTSKSIIISADSALFQRVEIEPQFPGGNAAWIKYLQSNLNPEVPINNNAKTGSYNVVIKFIVSKDGSISNLVPVTHFGYGMEEEVIRVLKKGPNWMPGVQNGRKVIAYRSQMVTFFVP